MAVRVAEAQVAHEVKRVGRGMQVKTCDRARRVEQPDRRTRLVVHAKGRAEALVPVDHVQKVDVLAVELKLGPAHARHETRQADQGMQIGAPAARAWADSVPVRHGPGRIGQVGQALIESMAPVDVRAYQEPKVPAGLPETERAAGQVCFQWRVVGARMRKLAQQE